MQFILHLDPQEEDERVEVYAREERPLLQELETLTLATFSHFLLALAGVATTGLVLRWFPLTPAGFAIFGLIFFLVYSLIWGISWLRTSRSVQELQEKLGQQA